MPSHKICQNSVKNFWFQILLRSAAKCNQLVQVASHLSKNFQYMNFFFIFAIYNSFSFLAGLLNSGPNISRSTTNAILVTLIPVVMWWLQETSWLSWLFEKVVIVMVIYFVISIIHSMAQSYHKHLAQQHAASSATSSRRPPPKTPAQSDWPIDCLAAAQMLLGAKHTRAMLLLRTTTVVINPPSRRHREAAVSQVVGQM